MMLRQVRQQCMRMVGCVLILLGGRLGKPGEGWAFGLKLRVAATSTRCSSVLIARKQGPTR